MTLDEMALQEWLKGNKCPIFLECPTRYVYDEKHTCILNYEKCIGYKFLFGEKKE